MLQKQVPSPKWVGDPKEVFMSMKVSVSSKSQVMSPYPGEHVLSGKVSAPDLQRNTFEFLDVYTCEIFQSKVMQHLLKKVSKEQRKGPL